MIEEIMIEEFTPSSLEKRIEKHKETIEQLKLITEMTSDDDWFIREKSKRWIKYHEWKVDLYEKVIQSGDEELIEQFTNNILISIPMREKEE